MGSIIRESVSKHHAVCAWSQQFPFMRAFVCQAVWKVRGDIRSASSSRWKLLPGTASLAQPLGALGLTEETRTRCRKHQLPGPGSSGG